MNERTLGMIGGAAGLVAMVLVMLMINDMGGCSSTRADPAVTAQKNISATQQEVVAREKASEDYVETVKAHAVKISTAADQASAGLVSSKAPPATVAVVSPPLKVVKAEATTLTTDADTEKTKLKEDLAVANTTIVALTGNVKDVTTERDEAIVARDSAQHKWIMAIIVSFVVAGAVMIGLGIWEMVSSAGVSGRTLVEAGAAIWGVASLLGFYDKYSVWFEIGAILAVAGVVAYLVIGHMNWTDIKTKAKALFVGLENEEAVIVGDVKTEYTALHTKVFGTPKTPPAGATKPVVVPSTPQIETVLAPAVQTATA